MVRPMKAKEMMDHLQELDNQTRGATMDFKLSNSSDINPLDAAPAFFSNKHAAAMLLRDYFAAKAMQGLISENMFRHEPNAGTAIAGAAYDMADCMMEARKPTPHKNWCSNQNPLSPVNDGRDCECNKEL